ncbi:hypothetical protein SETIT_1G145100v2 [Setaria italica]|uniref:Uncharacterized protein n=1 Tax=Setaria italica TaxID=4555 RepID=A0A368PK89_SETIT|nr:hypothetical protein SETIT_1G145100v2 [Setaria italica]
MEKIDLMHERVVGASWCAAAGATQPGTGRRRLPRRGRRRSRWRRWMRSAIGTGAWPRCRSGRRGRGLGRLKENGRWRRERG